MIKYPYYAKKGGVSPPKRTVKPNYLTIRKKKWQVFPEIFSGRSGKARPEAAGKLCNFDRKERIAYVFI